ncbi:MAG: type II toxin-antitoxin system YoeB family toxin [Candidatus Competibacteraceae bacterium]|nr:type II toxin-antitoxin system YoeB family toxin [Candidatus Competibacteraceae bacterium]
MKIRFHEIAWNKYLDWQQTDKAKIKRINLLVKEIQRHPFEGTGKPEPLSMASILRNLC